MATAVEAPKLGNTVDEVLIARWIKRKGDAVSAGDIVAEIETDKATFEVAAPVGGSVLATFFDEGALVPVFTNLFVIGTPGESIEAFRPHGAFAPPEPAVTAAPVAVPDAPRTTAGSLSPPMSPRARRFADRHNFHPESVGGSGPGGRILEQDLRRLYESAGAPISGIRERIARRMRESLAATAQYTLNSSADATRLLSLRARLKNDAATAHININDLVAFAVIRALRQMPDLNAHFVDGRLQKHAAIHLGFACDTPRGLMVPVIRDAGDLSLSELSTRAKELAARAVQGDISPDDLAGATFTISNLGGLGIESFTPLLNPPQVAILGVGAIHLRPVRHGGQVEFADFIGLSLTCDHQVIDGAPGARFLQVVKQYIENVELS